VKESSGRKKMSEEGRHVMLKGREHQAIEPLRRHLQAGAAGRAEAPYLHDILWGSRKAGSAAKGGDAEGWKNGRC